MLNDRAGKHYRGAMPNNTPGNNPTGGKIREDLLEKLLDPESYKDATFAKNVDKEPQAHVKIDGYDVTATNLESGIVFDIEHKRQHAHANEFITSPVGNFKGADVPTDGAILEVLKTGETNTFLKKYQTMNAPEQQRIPLQDTKVDPNKATAIMDLINQKTTAPALKKGLTTTASIKNKWATPFANAPSLMA